MEHISIYYILYMHVINHEKEQVDHEQPKNF
jgi:hypothetical protein